MARSKRKQGIFMKAKHWLSIVFILITFLDAIAIRIFLDPSHELNLIYAVFQSWNLLYSLTGFSVLCTIILLYLADYFKVSNFKKFAIVSWITYQMGIHLIGVISVIRTSMQVSKGYIPVISTTTIPVKISLYIQLITLTYHIAPYLMSLVAFKILEKMNE